MIQNIVYIITNFSKEVDSIIIKNFIEEIIS